MCMIVLLNVPSSHLCNYIILVFLFFCVCMGDENVNVRHNKTFVNILLFPLGWLRFIPEYRKGEGDLNMLAFLFTVNCLIYFVS